MRPRARKIPDGERLLGVLGRQPCSAWSYSGNVPCRWGAGGRAQGAEEAIVARAAAVGVGVYGISRYAIRRGPPGLMLGYSRMSEEEIREGIRRLATALNAS